MTISKSFKFSPPFSGPFGVSSKTDMKNDFNALVNPPGRRVSEFLHDKIFRGHFAAGGVGEPEKIFVVVVQHGGGTTVLNGTCYYRSSY